MSDMIKLKKFAKVITGFPFKGELYSDDGIRTVRGENVTEGKLRWDTIKCWNQPFEKEEEYLLKDEDVVIGMDGSKVGKNKARIKSYDLPLLLAQRVACVRTTGENNQTFLYYLINNPRFEEYVFKTQTGSSVPHISKTQIEDFLVPEIDLISQQRIASILSSLDDKIELNNKINAELDAMAKLIYDYWFVQFDFPNEQGKPYKSSGGKMVWNEEVKREVPEGWEVKSLQDIESNIITGKTPPTNVSEYYNGNIPFICIGDVRDNMHITSSEITLTELGANSQVNKFIPEGAICVTCIASPGLVGFATEPSQTNQQLNSVVCKNFENRYFLYFYLKDYFRFAQAKTGNTFANMNKGDFSSIKVIKPEKKILLEFSKILKPSIELNLLNSKQNQHLASLRDWLLPMLMNRQVTVEEVYKQVEEQLGMVAEPQENYTRA